MSGLESKKTVVPFDFSDLSIAAVDCAVQITGKDGTVEVVHVLAQMSAMEPGLMYGMPPDETRIAGIIEKLQQQFVGDKYSTLTMHCLVGDTGREITEFAEREGADLIVIPSHGYGFVKHVLLGSVAERVVRLAHCPVLVLRN